MTRDEERERYLADRRAKLEAELQRKGVRPIQTGNELRCDEIFETDEELDEFLAYLDAKRERYR